MAWGADFAKAALAAGHAVVATGRNNDAVSRALGQMNRDELEGKAKALKGKIKQATGDVTNNPRLHHEGAVDEVAGKAQGAVGRIRRKVGDVIEDVGNAMKQ